MDYVILDKNVIINNVEYSNFVNIVDIQDEKANVNISNTEIYLSVPINITTTEVSIKEFFANKIEVQ